MKKQAEIKINGIIKNQNGSVIDEQDLVEKLKEIGLIYESGELSQDLTVNKRSRSKLKKTNSPNRELQRNNKQRVIEAEKSGLMATTGIVFGNPKTGLNKELSDYFKAELPKFNAIFTDGEDGNINTDKVLENVNKYLEESGIDQKVDYTQGYGINLFLVPITENLELKVLVVDEYVGDKYPSSLYISIEEFMINDQTTKKDVDELVEFAKEYLKQ